MFVLLSRMGVFAKLMSVRLPTRTMKNSCKLDEKMETKVNRSSSGTLSSAPWSSTRSLNVSHESSRFCMNGACGGSMIVVVLIASTASLLNVFGERALS